MRDKENELFKEWRAKRPKLVRDGLINVESYLTNNLKVLYILKEVNAGEGGGGNWDLSQHLREGKSVGHTWNNVVRWQYLLEKISEDLPITWDKLPEITDDFRTKMLQKLVFLNIKKDHGGGTANPKEIWTYSWNDKDLLTRQINLYKADIVVCCGTGRIVRERKLIENLKLEKSKTGINYSVIDSEGHKQIIIDFSHPANRISAKKMFNLLCDTYNEINNTKNE